MTVVSSRRRSDDGIIEDANPALSSRSDYLQLLREKWIDERQDEWGEPLVVHEFDDDRHDDGYRSKHGWKGRDLIHDRNAPVRITQYFVKYGPGDDTIGLVGGGGGGGGGVGTCLTGIVVFTERAESHRGFCHGGSMCSVMDDVIGWCGFCVTGSCQPWSGFTVQINTSLTKPIMVHTTLLVQATITKVERRKVYITAVLIDPNDKDAVHAKCEGIVVVNKGVLPGY